MTASGVAAVLVGGLIAVLPQPARAATLPPQVAGLADSSTLATPIVAEGTVTNSAGTAVSKGTVALVAWPSDESDVAVGDTVTLTPIGRATSTSSGSYALRVDPSVDLTAVAEDDGSINAELEAYSGSTLVGVKALTIPAGAGLEGAAASSSPTDPSAAVSSGSAGADEPVVPGDTSGATVGPTYSTGPIYSTGPSASANVAAEATSGQLTVRKAAASVAAPVAVQEIDLGGSPDATPALVAEPDVAPRPPGCSATKGASLGVHYGIVGQTYSETTGVKHTFVYTSGASTSIGVGVQGSGGGGSFSSSGTRSVSSTVTEYFPTYGDHTYRYYKTGWNFNLWHINCASGSGKSHSEIRPGSFAGGAVTSAASAPSAHKCVYQTAGSKYVQSKTKAITWSNGVSFSYGGVGVNLSTETGYSSSAEVSYSFNSSRYLCGSGSTPGGTPYVLSAKSTNS